MRYGPDWAPWKSISYWAGTLTTAEPGKEVTLDLGQDDYQRSKWRHLHVKS